MNALFESASNIAIVCAVTIGVVLTIVFALKRLVSASIWQKLLVLGLNCVAGIAIIGLVIDFHYVSNKPVVVVLISPNTSEDVIDQYINDNQNYELKLVNLANKIVNDKEGHIDNGNLKTPFSESENDDIISISDIAQLSLFYPSPSQITLLGDGLTPEQWHLLTSQYSIDKKADSQTEISTISTKDSPVFVEHIGFDPKLGLTDVQWPKQLTLGQQGLISGKLQTTSMDEDTLYNLTLIDPMKRVVDSQTIGANDTFSFSFVATIPGQWLYQLALTPRNEAITAVTENINVHVVNGTPFALMIKQSAPSFESRHLQNTIAETGGKVLTLSKISKDKEISQQVNFRESEKPLLNTPFAINTLELFDALLIDQQALLTLSKAESAVLDTAIKQGLGVIVQVQDKHINEWPIESNAWLKAFRLSQTPRSHSSQELHYLRWQYQGLDTPISSVNANIETASANNLVTNANNKPLVASAEYGMGQVAVSLINTSHIWKTEGRRALHSHYWQWIFSQISRSNELAYWQSKMQKNPTFSAHAQQDCIANSQNTAALSLFQNGKETPLYTTSHLIDANIKCVQYSPIKVGWYLLQTKEPINASIALYANKPSDWEAWQQSLRNVATQTAIRNQILANRQENTREILVNPYWFWTLLVTALLALWIERKYYS